MNPLNPHIHARLYVFLALASASLIALAALFWSGATIAARGEARPGTPEEFGKYIRSEYDKWGRLIREAGISQS